jgi:protein TonB
VVVGLALVFTAQVQPVLQEEVFQWNVALVGSTTPESIPEPVQSAITPAQAPAKRISQPSSTRVTELAHAVRPLERKIEPIQEIVQQVETAQPHEEATVRRAAEMVEPIVEAKQTESVAVADSADAVRTLPGQEDPVRVATAARSSHETVAPQEDSTGFPSHEAGVDTAPVEVVKAPASDPEARIDNQWLAEALWRRVAELKRYPNSARMNAEEGKVIVKAVIRSDGHLADISVQTSSGHSVLDAAAIEAVKLACPIHMKHAIGKPQIVVNLPIVYSLAN